jgi:methionyl-tRNA formyltransferase
LKTLILITGCELRHEFFRKFISTDSEIKVVKSYCESSIKSIENVVSKDSNNQLRKSHLEARSKSEKYYFERYCAESVDLSNPKLIKKGEINDPGIVAEIIKSNPDYIVSYGCSIIKSELIEFFRDRFINIHLGLSPYYRGSGTNYWPFVFDELQFIGVTFMFINEGIDTGEIIHQIRAEILECDSIHDIGNRLITAMSKEVILLIKSGILVKSEDTYSVSSTPRRYFSKKDFTEESLLRVSENFSKNIIGKYLSNRGVIDAKYPIFENNSFKSI